MRIVLFDICGTLYKSNTTYDFLKFYFRRKNRLKGFLLAVVLARPFNAIWLVIHYLFPSWDIRAFLISFIKGQPVSEVEPVARLFVIEFLRQRERSVMTRLKEYKEGGADKIVLCSSSIEPVVQAIASDLKVDVYGCSRLEVESGVYTGKLVFDLQGKKHEWVDRSFNLADFSEVVCFSDNLEDLPLLARADKRFIIAKEKRKQYWKKHIKDVEFVE